MPKASWQPQVSGSDDYYTLIVLFGEYGTDEPAYRRTIPESTEAGSDDAGTGRWGAVDAMVRAGFG